MKRLTSLLLLAALMLGAFSCASQTATNDTSETTASDTSAPEVTTEAEPTPEELYDAAKSSIPEIDYDGYTFTIGARGTGAFMTVDVFSEEENGDPINDAVYERNTFLSERMNIKIVDKLPDGSPAADAKKSVLADEHIYDAVNDGLYNITTNLVVDGCAVDLAELPGLDMSDDSWDNELIGGLSINDKVYFATGDISIMDNYGTWCILFNKDILNDFGLDDPYVAVKDGTWDLDVMYDMIKAVAVDLDGDSVMGDWDQYGLLTESFNTFGFWSGAGEKIITKDADDLPELSLYNERSEAVVQKVMQFQMDESCVMGSDRHKRSNVPEGIDPVDIMFKGGYSLFIFGGLWLVSDYRSSEVDFGIIPAPKYDESQDNYYSTYSHYNCAVYSVPITIDDPELTGNVLQAMSVISKHTLTPAYYDIALEGKYLRDEESGDMIDLILATRNYDLGSIFDWGSCFSLFTELYTSKSTDFSSKYMANESKILAAIEDFRQLDFIN